MKTTCLSNNTIAPKSSRTMRQLCGLAIAAIGLGASLPSARAQVTATGGTITSYTDGGITYDVHTFTGSGTFNVTGGGSVDYLIVGGGGGGGGGTGGGGGAGGFVTGTTTVTDSTAYTITVGAGGAGGRASTSPYRGTNGEDSVFAGVTAVGGGGGGSNYPNPAGFTDPSVGGSGGGGSGGAGRPGASGTSLQGNAGGNVVSWSGPFTPGGGGGAGAAGTNGNGQGTGAAGGAGLSSSITGVAKFYAGGGGSGNFNGSRGGLGGVGGGGNGGKPNAPTSGAANTGGGGGGQHQNNLNDAAGSGGSGIVIIRFISTSPNPTSTNATLAADENTEIALTASNFGYADPGSVALAAVQITSLPALGTLKLSGTPVVSGSLPLTVAVADIGNLTYLSPLGGFGSPYTTMGIKVQNANTLLSTDALMTVNVTDVNQAPTSTGGSLIIGKNTVKTFAAADFPFSDIDAGDTFQAIKVTSLPVNGTLALGGTPITSVPSAAIPVANIGTLTYTPVSNYTGSDPFNFQVRDAALFSADATMALTVTSDIIVTNGSFETRGGINNASFWWSLGSPWVGGISPQGYEVLQVNQFNTFTAAADGLYAANLESWLVSVTQNLNTTVQAGDTLSMTFSGGRAKAGNGALSNGGKFTATFKVGTTEYTSSEFDTGLQANDTWQSYTFTTPITNTGNLSIIFRPVSGRPWLDKVSNISVTAGSGSFTLTYTAGANGTISGTSPQTVSSGGNGTAVTAVPNTNYHFVNWSDSSIANPRTDSNVTANVSVTANFAIDTYTDWATANGVTGGVNGDSNNDGVLNGVAYFMGVTGPASNPGLDASNEVIWPVNPNYQGTFEVQTSPDLGAWTPADPQPTPSGGNLTYILPPNAPGGKSFVRLLVTPN